MLRAIALFTVLFLVLSVPSASGTSTLLLRDGGMLQGELLNPGEVNRRTFHI